MVLKSLQRMLPSFLTRNNRAMKVPVSPRYPLGATGAFIALRNTTFVVEKLAIVDDLGSRMTVKHGGSINFFKIPRYWGCISSFSSFVGKIHALVVLHWNCNKYQWTMTWIKNQKLDYAILLQWKSTVGYRKSSPRKIMKSCTFNKQPTKTANCHLQKVIKYNCFSIEFI